MNPGRDREVTIADIHGLLPGDRHRIAILLKRHRSPKRGLDKVGLALQPAPVHLAIQGPRSGQPLGQARRVRGHLLVRAGRRIDVHLINSSLGNGDGLRGFGFAGHDNALDPAVLRDGTRIQQQPVVVSRRCHRHAKPPLVRQFAQRNLEVRLGPVRAIGGKDLIVGDGGPQQQSRGNRAVGAPFRIAVVAAHTSEDGVIDAVVISPAAHGIVARIAFDETVFGPHGKRVEGEGFARRLLGYQEIFVRQQ